MTVAEYVCPRCKGSLQETGPGFRCVPCSNFYPAPDGVPYLVVYGKDWYLKLREVLLYRDFCRKLKSAAIERDRIAGHEEMGAIILENLTKYFDQACKRINFELRPRVLDIGAGCGEVSERLAQLGADVFAVDTNMIDLHHDVRWMTFNQPADRGFCERIRGIKIESPGFHRAIADADYLPFPDGYFDYVVLRAVAHHLLDLGRSFAEANRVLKAGGQLILISEPLASVLDNPAEYNIGDLDYEEGMHETRPYFHSYHRALKTSNFRDIQVQCFFVGFGFRMTRLQQRLKLGYDLNARLSRRLASGCALPLLDFTAGCMNLYAVKGTRRLRPPQDPQEHHPDVSLAELMQELHDNPSRAEAVIRDYLPDHNLTAHLDLAASSADRVAARGIREKELIGGREGRYLLTPAVFYVGPASSSAVLSITYHASAAEGHSPGPQFFINGKQFPASLKYHGWDTLTFPIGDINTPAIELRIEQPGLVSGPQSTDNGARDIGLAISVIELL